MQHQPTVELFNELIEYLLQLSSLNGGNHYRETQLQLITVIV